MAMKIIGAGFGRTGTMSMQAALEELGFKKCYHMIEVMKNGGHARFWHKASQGQPVEWDQIFEGYQATVDWPGCTFYKELIAQYPDAKVVLNVRDPERWYDSTHSTIYQLRQGWFGSLNRLLPRLDQMAKMINHLIWEGTFHGRFEDKAYALHIFNEHIAEVKRIVPPERLLVYEVKQGWEPLCRFLDVPVPQNKPFPHLNDKARMQRIIKYRKIVTEWVPATILGLLVYVLGSRLIDRD
ncbi:MAG: sulfotransferase family protein [Ardenticatenaceae bacterium]